MPGQTTQFAAKAYRAAASAVPATLILGVGNILLRDEGAGVRAVEVLREMDLPRGVEALDGGTLGMDLLDLIADRERLIVIDVVRAGGPPGTVYRLCPDNLIRPDLPHLSLHQAGLMEALAMAGQLGCAPREVVIFGIEPRVIDYGLDLSDEVAAVLPKVVALVLAKVFAPA
jgi:hydrogenase maturation protease